MRTHVLTLAAAFALLASLAGCPKKDEPANSFGGSGTGSVVITASKSTVLANGTNYVDLSVTNTTGAAVTLTLSPAGRGTLSATSVPGAAGTVTLTTCVAGVGTCTGVATVTATSGTATDDVAVTFATAATICATDCTADAACFGQNCSGGTDYTCSGTFPALSCTAPVSGGGGGGGGSGALGALVPADPPVQFRVLGAAGSGWQEYGWVQVQVLDDAGNPFADGTTVHFEHMKLGGSTLATPTVACGTPSASCVRHDSLVAGGKGLASVWLYAGTVAGTLQVTATVTDGAITRSLSLPTVAVVGAKANSANFSIVCSPRNVPALAQNDCSTSWVDAPYTCVALAKDRYNNLLGTPTQIIFASEAGGVGQVAITPEYDPAQDPVTQKDLGSALEIFNTLGAGLPFDVAPQTGEPRWTSGVATDPDACPTNPDGFSRTHNPRDGVVTVIAIADGEEAFFDSNGNGIYDLGEPFIDQGEPFVDQNDNGQWDTGEWFLDVNGTRAYDGPNATWDGTTKIWTQTVVVYTGQPVRIDTSNTGVGPYLGVRIALNALATPAGADYGPACVPTPKPANFAVLAGAVPGTATRDVFASDANLNMLTAETTYDTVVSLGAIEANYFGLKQYADDLGFFYRYWPCDTAGTGACASQCRATGGAIPCRMKPAVSNFSCGPWAGVTIVGSSSPDPGIDRVDWQVSTPYVIFNNYDVIANWWEPQLGTSN